MNLKYYAVTLVFLSVMSYSPIQASETVLQPTPSDSKDIWTTSVYSYTPGGGGPGGGLDNEWLEVGGWADLYYTLIEFDLSEMPSVALSATLNMYIGQSKGAGTTGMYLDRITEFWDWTTQGTGSDYERLWWADRPNAVQWLSGTIPAPTVGQWCVIDITDLYNAWQNGTYPNYGLQLRPMSNSNMWNEFYSSNFLDSPSLRPMLVVTHDSCPNGVVLPECREIASGGLLFAERYSIDATALYPDNVGEARFYDTTSVTITRAPGDQFYISGSPTALTDWVCDDRLYINGTYFPPVGFDGIIDSAFPICEPMQDILSPVPFRPIIDETFIPMGTNCIEFKLADTQRELLGNSNIYLVKYMAIETEASSWGAVKTRYR